MTEQTDTGGTVGGQKFMARACKAHCKIAAELSEQIKELIYANSDRIPLALVIGVLRVVEHELLGDAHDTEEVKND